MATQIDRFAFGGSDISVPATKTVSTARNANCSTLLKNRYR